MDARTLSWTWATFFLSLVPSDFRSRTGVRPFDRTHLRDLLTGPRPTRFPIRAIRQPKKRTNVQVYEGTSVRSDGDPGQHYLLPRLGAPFARTGVHPFGRTDVRSLVRSLRRDLGSDFLGHPYGRTRVRKNTRTWVRPGRRVSVFRPSVLSYGRSSVRAFFRSRIRPRPGRPVWSRTDVRKDGRSFVRTSVHRDVRTRVRVF